MKKIIIVFIVCSLYLPALAQKERVAGGSCHCPNGWASCTANCWFSDCCICFNPATSEAGCGCWFGVARCQTGAMGHKMSGNLSNENASVRFSFERFIEMLSYLEVQKIEVSSIMETVVEMRTKYPENKGMTPVKVSDLNAFVDAYEAFINVLDKEQKSIIEQYIAIKEKTQ